MENNKTKSVITLAIFMLTLLFSQISLSQPWRSNLPQEKVKTETLTFFDYQKAFYDYWAPYHVENGYYINENGEKVKASGWKQFKRWEEYWEGRVDQVSGEFPEKTAWDYYQEYLKEYPDASRSTSGDWTSMGPSTTGGGYAGLGRMNCIGFRPGSPNTFYVGSPSGGIWKTTDGGSNWTCLSDDNASLGVSDIVVQSTTYDDIIYIATGDRDASDTYSVGVLKSTDGGTTWNTTGLNWTQNQQRRINRLLCDPNNNYTLYAATTAGLYKTTDGGTNWNLLTGTGFIDLEFKPGTSSTLYGSTTNGTIYKSTDSGSSWSLINTIAGGNRTQLAVTYANSSVIYAVSANGSNALQGIYKSTDSGSTWSLVYNSLNLLGWACDGSGTSGQGWYDLCIITDPSDANLVFVGGVNTWKSTNGGTSWSISNHWSSSCGGSATNVHADKHFLAYQPNTGVLFECNDGGVYKTSNSGGSWQHIGSGLVTSQMYRLGVGQTADDEVITGLQDNGSKALLNGTWYDVLGGDGMECLIDYTNENTQYGEYYYGNLQRTTNHWSTSTDITPSGASGAWVTPFCLDPNNHNTIFAGYTEVYKSTNQGSSWTTISTNLTSGNTLRSITVAASNSSYIYTATRYTIWRTTNGGSSWADITGGNFPGNTITYITVKNDDPNTAWVTFSGYNNGNRVYETTNGGSSWTNISTGLPHIPVNCVIQNTQNTTDVELYAATDLGVYVKVGNANWAPFMDGLPNVVVRELEIYYDSDPDNSMIRAATYGRGLWESDLYSFSLAPDADFSADNLTPTIVDTVSFTDLSTNTPVSWLWTFNPSTVTFLNGTTNTSQNPQVRFDVPGPYDVSLTASNASGSDTEFKAAYINATHVPPLADFEANNLSPTTIDTVFFTDLSANTPDWWLWTFTPATVTYANGTDENSQNPDVVFDEVGYYTVQLVAANDGGQDTMIKVDYIEAREALSVVVSATPDEICVGEPSQLEAVPSGGSGTYTYSWTSDPEGFSSDDNNPVVTPTETTTYFVEVDDGEHIVNGDVQVVVNPLPEITLGNWPDELCHMQEPPVQLTATPEGGTYSGDAVTPDGIFSPEEAPLGWNVITYTYTDGNGCENSAADSIYVDDCVGIRDHHASSDVLIFPNPNKGSFTIKSSSPVSKVEIIDTKGNTVFTKDTSGKEFRISSILSKGIYFVRIHISDSDNNISIVYKKLIIK
jgi:PKD repeat protein